MEPPLTELGQRQALEAAKLLRNEPRIDAVVTSHLIRARQTGAIIREHLGIATADIVEDLQERDIGKYQGLTRKEIRELKAGSTNDTDMGWEDTEAFGRRITSAFREVARRYPGKRVIVISHGGSLGRLCDSLGVEAARFTNLSGRHFEVNNKTEEILIGDVILAPSVEDDVSPRHQSQVQQNDHSAKEGTIL